MRFFVQTVRYFDQKARFSLRTLDDDFLEAVVPALDEAVAERNERALAAKLEKISAPDKPEPKKKNGKREDWRK